MLGNDHQDDGIKNNEVKAEFMQAHREMCRMEVVIWLMHKSRDAAARADLLEGHLLRQLAGELKRSAQTRSQLVDGLETGPRAFLDEKE